MRDALESFIESTIRDVISDDDGDQASTWCESLHGRVSRHNSGLFLRPDGITDVVVGSQGHKESLEADEA